MARRDPLAGYKLSELIRPRRKPAKEKPEKRTRAIYTVPEPLRDRIKEIADQEMVWPSDIARLFLEMGITLYENGHLEEVLEEMKEPLVTTRFTLYGGSRTS